MPDSIADFMNDNSQPIEFAEMFLADPRVTVGEDGLIWKPMLRTGTWIEGPNGRPFKVVAGNGSDYRKQVVGIKDVVEAFEDGAHENVTVPLSHDDKTDENTGFVRKMKTHVSDDGSTWLLGGHEFTEPEIREKVLRGTIPNTSAGLRFEYRRRSDGKRYPAVMRHNALTPHPLMDRLAPFGVNASETEDTYNLHSLQFSDDAVADQSTMDALHEKVRETLTDTTKPMRERVDTAKKIMEDAQSTFSDDSTSSPTATIPVTPSAGDEDLMADENKDKKKEGEEKTVDSPTSVVAPPSNPFVLAEDPTFKALKEENERLKNERASDKAQLDQLTTNQRKIDADDGVKLLKKVGFTEENGCTPFLQEAHRIFLADEGEAVLLLADGDDQAPRPFTATALVKRLVEKLPKNDSGVLAMLAEQTTDPLRRSSTLKPPITDPEEPKAEVDDEDVDAVFSEMFGGRSTAPSNGTKPKTENQE